MAAPYEDPYSPPEFVSPLPPEESAKLVTRLLATIDGSHNRVDGFSFGPFDYKPGAVLRFQKDSKQFTGDDIRALAHIIRSDTGHDHFLITHGTDKMTENAQQLQQELEHWKVKGKRVVFCGSMLPLSMQQRFPKLGDAEANMRFALEQYDGLKPGVYVAARDSATQRMICTLPGAIHKDLDKSKADLQFTVKGR